MKNIGEDIVEDDIVLNNLLKDFATKLRKTIEKAIYSKKKSQCSECGRLNYKGIHRLMSGNPYCTIDTDTPIYDRKCRYCGREWTTEK